MQDVAIIGVGQSVFSRKCGVAIRELCFEAYTEAMEGLDITNKDIDASIICSAPEYDKQCSPRRVMNEATLPDLSDSSPFDHWTALMAQDRFDPPTTKVEPYGAIVPPALSGLRMTRGEGRATTLPFSSRRAKL